MRKSVSLFLFVFLAMLIFSSGCSSLQRQKVYSCPSCKAVVPASATTCPNCGQRLTPVSTNPTAAGRTVAARPAGGAGGDRKFPPVKVGGLLEITDGNHQRVAPFVSVELFRIEQGRDAPVICFDAGVAEDAIFGSAGVRGIIPDAPYFGFFIFGMFDFRRTIKPRLYGPHQPHFCSGVGVTFGGF